MLKLQTLTWFCLSGVALGWRYHIIPGRNKYDNKPKVVEKHNPLDHLVEVKPRLSAHELCREHPADCQFLLRYGKRSGYQEDHGNFVFKRMSNFPYKPNKPPTENKFRFSLFGKRIPYFVSSNRIGSMNRNRILSSVMKRNAFDVDHYYDHRSDIYTKRVPADHVLVRSKRSVPGGENVESTSDEPQNSRKLSEQDTDSLTNELQQMMDVRLFFFSVLLSELTKEYHENENKIVQKREGNEFSEGSEIIPVEENQMLNEVLNHNYAITDRAKWNERGYVSDEANTNGMITTHDTIFNDDHKSEGAPTDSFNFKKRDSLKEDYEGSDFLSNYFDSGFTDGSFKNFVKKAWLGQLVS